jgi:hypothetical protein
MRLALWHFSSRINPEVESVTMEVVGVVSLPVEVATPSVSTALLEDPTMLLKDDALEVRVGENSPVVLSRSTACQMRSPCRMAFVL